jgi:FMN phosphatase YigB (HAD superfamily)
LKRIAGLLAKYRHVSFDLDGTLVHTLPEYRYRVVSATVRALGGATPSTRSIDRFWFEARRSQIVAEEFMIDPLVFWKLFVKLDEPAERARHTRVYDEAETVLRRLKAEGKLLSVITGSPRWIAEMELAKLNGVPLDLTFSIDYTRFQEKPDPASFHFVLGELEVRPEETLYVGNSDEDAEFARNAGVDFLYLERREHPFSLRDQAVAMLGSLGEIFSL